MVFAPRNAAAATIANGNAGGFVTTSAKSPRRKCRTAKMKAAAVKTSKFKPRRMSRSLPPWMPGTR